MKVAECSEATHGALVWRSAQAQIQLTRSPQRHSTASTSLDGAVSGLTQSDKASLLEQGRAHFDGSTCELLFFCGFGDEFEQ